MVRCEKDHSPPGRLSSRVDWVDWVDREPVESVISNHGTPLLSSGFTPRRKTRISWLRCANESDTGGPLKFFIRFKLIFIVSLPLDGIFRFFPLSGIFLIARSLLAEQKTISHRLPTFFDIDSKVQADNFSEIAAFNSFRIIGDETDDVMYFFVG